MDAIVAPKRINPLAVIAAILLPPLGVFLDRGLGRLFWVSVVLTLLAFLPGVVFALFTTLHIGF